MTNLPLNLTNHLTDCAIKKATSLGVKVSIAIVDNAAFLKSFQRMDDALLGPVDVCIRKARAAVLFGVDSGDFGTSIINDKLVGMENTNHGLATFPGGKLIIVDGKQVGAIGVSGASAEQDKAIAESALESLNQSLSSL